MNLPIPHDGDCTPIGPVEIPSDCPLLSEITAEFSKAGTTLLLQLYAGNPADQGRGRLHSRAQLFDDGRLIEHHTAAYRGPAVDSLAKLWLSMPAELRETTGITEVRVRIYPQRPAA